MSISLDTLDVRILDSLQRDVTVPVNDLADQLASTCWCSRT